MKEVSFNDESFKDVRSMDDFLNILSTDGSDGSSYTAAVVNASMERLFPDSNNLSKMMLVSNLTNHQITCIVKLLHSAYALGLTKEKLGHPSVYERRLSIIEDFLRLRVSINHRGRSDIVESLKAIMLNEVSQSASRMSRLIGGKD